MADLTPSEATGAVVGDNAPTEDASGEVVEARRLIDRYLAALGLEGGERRRFALTVMREARAGGSGRLVDRAFTVLELRAGIGPASAESRALEVLLPDATPPERHAPMPEHDLAAAWRRPPVGAVKDEAGGEADTPQGPI